MLFSDLEMLVMDDIYSLGLDPANEDDINYYWGMMLDGY